MLDLHREIPTGKCRKRKTAVVCYLGSYAVMRKELGKFPLYENASGARGE